MRLDPTNTGLLVIDVQERLFPAVDRADQVAKQMVKVIEGAKVLALPIVTTEQYPEGLGPTIPYLADQLVEPPMAKTTFSALGHPAIRKLVESRPHWLLVGIEAHICVLQTARDLIEADLIPIVLSDAISSRSLYDLSVGIAEARDLGARISTVETVLFELLADAQHPAFKAISRLVK